MKNENDRFCNCGPVNLKSGCCRVESIVNLDPKGQILLPKDLREKTKIQPGDKLVIVSWGDDTNPRCITLIKADYFGDLVKKFLGPMMKDLSQE